MAFSYFGSGNDRDSVTLAASVGDLLPFGYDDAEVVLGAGQVIATGDSVVVREAGLYLVGFGVFWECSGELYARLSAGTTVGAEVLLTEREVPTFAGDSILVRLGAGDVVGVQVAGWVGGGDPVVKVYTYTLRIMRVGVP